MEKINNEQSNINCNNKHNLHSNETCSNHIFCFQPIFVYPIQKNKASCNEVKGENTNKQIGQNNFLLFSQNSNINDFINKNYIKSKKETYRKGVEYQKLSKLPHFNEPFDDLDMYKILGRPDKSRINEIGDKYNNRFEKEIKDGLYTKFGRDQKRNKALAIWFFEDRKAQVVSWLKEIGLIV